MFLVVLAVAADVKSAVLAPANVGFVNPAGGNGVCNDADVAVHNLPSRFLFV